MLNRNLILESVYSFLLLSPLPLDQLVMRNCFVGALPGVLLSCGFRNEYIESRADFARMSDESSKNCVLVLYISKYKSSAIEDKKVNSDKSFRRILCPRTETDRRCFNLLFNQNNSQPTRFLFLGLLTHVPRADL